MIIFSVFRRHTAHASNSFSNCLSLLGLGFHEIVAILIDSGSFKSSFCKFIKYKYSEDNKVTYSVGPVASSSVGLWSSVVIFRCCSLSLAWSKEVRFSSVICSNRVLASVTVRQISWAWGKQSWGQFIILLSV